MCVCVCKNKCLNVFSSHFQNSLLLSVSSTNAHLKELFSFPNFVHSRTSFVSNTFAQNNEDDHSRGQFHQRSMCSLYICKLRVQLFCAYVLGLYFTGARLLAQKLHVERW